VRDIHPCWAHLGGKALTEADLPRPISKDYKSIFDLPSTRTAAEQQQAIAAANAAPRVTLAADAAAAAEVIKAHAAAVHGERAAAVGVH
jgi:hypothetical protein